MIARVTVCGLGPGGPDHLTTETIDALRGADVAFLRTGRHPTASVAEHATTFDRLYEEADTFDEVYERIADAVVAAAIDGSVGSRTVYAVPGSPLVLEESVRRLRADERIDVELLPALSFLDVAWARLGVDPIEESVRLIDGHRFASEVAGQRGPLLIAHVHASWVLSDIKLAIDADDDQTAVVLQRLGTEEERLFEVPWSDLDRVVEPDHLTSLYVPTVTAPVDGELHGTVELMHRLRADCPWDRAQTHGSLRRYLIEETYEVVDVLDRLEALDEHEPPPGSDADAVGSDLNRQSLYADLEEELGDLWFQVLFHSEIAREQGHFTIADVARTLIEKMVRRHPHVFGDADSSEAAIVGNWERIKRAEKERTSALDGIPPGLPSLLLATKVVERAIRAGIAIGTVAEAQELTDEDSLGERLLALVVAAQRQGLDAEAALRSAVLDATSRFRDAERRGELPPRTWPLA